MNTLPVHLGGHENMTHIDVGALDLLMQRYDVKSMLDIGCGPGGMVRQAHLKGLDVLGVDGDFTVYRPKMIEPMIRIHDFVTGPFLPGRNFDLCWSVEFVEHVEECFMDNFIESMKFCKYVLMTHALPNQPGWHHVNCQTYDYWVDVMEKRGFKFDPTGTIALRAASTMNERYVRLQSLFFVNGSIRSV
jgi:hypothetical protein